MSENNLFTAFEKYTLEDWKDLIVKDLKGGSFESLITKTPEGLDIQPVYQKDEASSFNFLNAIQTDNESLPIRYWVNNYFIKVESEKEANTEALKVLNEGADGLIFQVNENTDFGILLKGIELAYCSVSLSSEVPNFNILAKYKEYINTIGTNKNEIKGAYLVDLLEKRDTGKIANYENSFQHLAEQIKNFTELPNFQCLNISSNSYHNAGANRVNELAFLLSKTAEYFDELTEQGLSIKEVIQSTIFSSAFGSNYFFEIAKGKVLKRHIQKICAAYGHKIEPSDVLLLGYTSNRTKSALDFHVNLLRNTTEAMAAILSGCDQLYVAPHDSLQKVQKSTFKRSALNISSVLKEEAHLDKVADPSLGSYYIDEIIQGMADSSWNVFLGLEKQGSYSVLFIDGIIKNMIKLDDEKASDAVISRQSVYIGANMFQNIGEKLDLAKTTIEDDEFLQERRIGWKVENLRARTENHVNKSGEEARPKATIIALGVDPVSKAKVDFTYSFLGMAGIKIQEDIHVKDQNKLNTILKNIESELIIFCFKDLSEDLSQHFKAATDHSKVLVAGAYEEEGLWKSEGLYACINRNIEAYSFLHQLLNDLNISE